MSRKEPRTAAFLTPGDEVRCGRCQWRKLGEVSGRRVAGSRVGVWGVLWLCEGFRYEDGVYRLQRGAARRALHSGVPRREQPRRIENGWSQGHTPVPVLTFPAVAVCACSAPNRLDKELLEVNDGEELAPILGVPVAQLPAHLEVFRFR